APTEAAVKAARSWLTKHSLTVTGVSPDNLLVHVRGSTGAVARAFGVAINDYRLGKRPFYAHARAPSVPSALQVHWISGLSNANVYRTTGRTRSTKSAVAGLKPKTVRKAYDVKTNGSGLKIGLAVWGRDLPQSDFNQFAATTGT